MGSIKKRWIARGIVNSINRLSIAEDANVEVGSLRTSTARVTSAVRFKSVNLFTLLALGGAEQLFLDNFYQLYNVSQFSC